MSIVRTSHSKSNPYVLINKLCLEDKKISWGAKGLWTYLLSKPDNWQVSITHLSKIYQSSGGGRDAIRGMVNELVDNGYAEKTVVRDKGKYVRLDYTVFEEKIIKSTPTIDYEPETDLPALVQPALVLATQTNIDHINYIEEQTNMPSDFEESFVCSFEEEDSQKRQLLEKYNIPDLPIERILKFDYEQIRQGCLAFDQWKENCLKQGRSMESDAAGLYKCIFNKWKPNFTKQDKIAEEEKNRLKKEITSYERRDSIRQLQETYAKSLKEGFEIIVYDLYVILKLPKNQTQNIQLTEESSVDYIRNFIIQNKN